MASLTRIALFLPPVRQRCPSPVVRDERPKLEPRNIVRKDTGAVVPLHFPIGYTRKRRLPRFERVEQTPQRKQLCTFYRRAMSAAPQTAGWNAEASGVRVSAEWNDPRPHRAVEVEV